MAKLKAHGRELGRWEYLTYTVALFDDGHLLRNHGGGWKLYRKAKQGVAPETILEHRNAKFSDRLRTRQAWVHYRELLHKAAPASERWRIDQTIEMMPDDADGVWSHCSDRYGLSIEECQELCDARRSMLAEAEFFNPKPVAA